MKKKLLAVLFSASVLFTTAMPAWAESAATESVSGEKAVTNHETNPNTGAVTLATVSVALAGGVILVFKKRK